MKLSIIAQSAFATTLLAYGGQAISAQEVQGAASEPGATTTTVSGQETSTPMAMSAGLCGVSGADVASIINYYQLDPDMQDVAAALAVPFDCSAYGDLCQAVSPPDAHAYVCGVWGTLVDHQSPDLVAEAAVNSVTQMPSFADCEPDPADCAEICDPRHVLTCEGTWYGGRCNALAICEFIDIDEVPFFGVLPPI